ncbi:MAG: class I SAM-dependent methyltransferase [Ruminobacter sp.]|nr:class I SAM-dependent methyltransferase [Ruminobacter sp.]
MESKIILHESRDKSLKRKHPWIFSKAIKEVVNEPSNGADINIYDCNNNFLAVAAYSPNSQIRARVWSFNKDEKIDKDFFKAKILKAYEARKLMLEVTAMSACRIIAAESDSIPGLIVDMYNNYLVLEVLSAGTEFHLKEIVAALREVFPEHNIYERSDVEVRKKEGLELRKGVIFGENPPTEIEITENENMKLLVDIENGHKTGYYLDQRDNRAALAKYCKGKSVLNCFSYTGGFSLYALKGRALKVANVDVSQRALDTAKRNIVLNHLDPGRVKFIKEDVFKFLRNEKAKNNKYDVIVLDPPKFAESRGQLDKACRGYKDINMLAASIINPGGYLMTYSCSGHMTPDLFQKVVADAILDANREGQIVEYLQQASDHPISTAYPEGLYLKGLVVRIY